jgi:SAM-dependent methyltransferase
MFRTTCVICDAHELRPVVDLGMHPFADRFIPPDQLSEPDLCYPLLCDRCTACGHVQNRCVTDPEDRYRRWEYSYTASNSASSRRHWQSFAAHVGDRTGLGSNDLVVEIGSNDGYLLEQFRPRPVLGVDASPHMARLAEGRGIATICGLFDAEIADRILREQGRARLVVANNVFNHIDRPVEFTRAVARLMAPEGTFVFEVPCWAEAVREGRFDLLYHEHVNSFTVSSCARVLARAELSISAVERVDSHGVSLRVYAQHSKSAPSDVAERWIAEETRAGLFEESTYEAFRARMQKRRSAFLEKVFRIKGTGGSILGVGAAAKGNTFLNYYRLDHTVLDYVTDCSDHKQGKYTPQSRIPICSDAVFGRYDSVSAIVLSWNISTAIQKVLCDINPRIKFLDPTQEVS